jgi:hypothetical protein
MRLKERSNLLLYAHNALHQDLEQLLDEDDRENSHTFSEDMEGKVQVAFGSCERLSTRVVQLRQEIEHSRKESHEKTLAEKERRIRLEYEVRLLRERKNDQAKKEGYFKGFYDEHRIQEVIDDMLHKEDALRAQIADQEAAIEQAGLDWERELEDRRRQGQRERSQRDEEAKLLQLEI